jgi:hypothetical protein
MSTHEQLTAGTLEHFHPGAIDSLQLSAVMPVAEVQRAALWQDAPEQAAAHRQGKGLKVAIDLAAGTFGGIAQLIVGHPFDTIKVKGCCSGLGPAKGSCWPAGPKIAVYASQEMDASSNLDASSSDSRKAVVCRTISSPSQHMSRVHTRLHGFALTGEAPKPELSSRCCCLQGASGRCQAGELTWQAS